MAINRKNTPVGIDFLIDKVQLYMWNKLSQFNSNWESYPRCYLNPAKGQNRGLVPEFFDDPDYVDVLHSDRTDLVTFFIVDDNRTINEGKFESEIELYVQASDINSLIPSLHRSDEELLIEFFNAADNYNKGGGTIKLKSVESGIDNVYSGIDTSKIRYNDMNDYSVFKLVFDAFYSCNCSC